MGLIGRGESTKDYIEVSFRIVLAIVVREPYRMRKALKAISSIRCLPPLG